MSTDGRLHNNSIFVPAPFSRRIKSPHHLFLISGASYALVPQHRIGCENVKSKVKITVI